MEIISKKEAKALGLNKYFTGEPCGHGHVAKRYTSNAMCSMCSYIYGCAAAKANPEENNRRAKAWWLAHKERHNVRNKEWRETNQEKIKAYRDANRERRREQKRLWDKLNPDKKHAHDNNRRARKRGNGGSHTATDIADLYRLQRGRCACGCNEPLKKKYHVDHIVPLSLGGGNDRRNLQLLRPACNQRKRNKHPAAFYREQGFLL